MVTSAGHTPSEGFYCQVESVNEMPYKHHEPLMWQRHMTRAAATNIILNNQALKCQWLWRMSAINWYLQIFLFFVTESQVVQFQIIQKIN